jgi:hypothetical protein
VKRLELYRSRDQGSVKAAVAEQAKYEQNPNKNLPTRHRGENKILSNGLIGR